MATMTKAAAAKPETSANEHAFVRGVHGIRYQAMDVARSIKFYTTHLGFTLKHKHLPEFANIALGDLRFCSAAGAAVRDDAGRADKAARGGTRRASVKDLPAFIALRRNPAFIFETLGSGPARPQMRA